MNQNVFASFGESDLSREMIAPLIALLDDTDTTVTTAVRHKLVSYGRSIVPYLREVIEREVDPTGDEQTAIYENAVAAFRGLQMESLSSLMNEVIDAKIEGGDIDLESAALRLSTFGYPEANWDVVRERLDAMAVLVHNIFMNMSTHNELSQLMSLNTVFFEQEDYRGATKNYYAPENSYLCTMISSKRGIPISISIAYMLVAERCGIELEGIGMPLHFLVYHPKINVFIDTFNHGAFISREECEQFIRQSGFSYSQTMLTKSTNIGIVMRMIRNLIYAHSKFNQKWEADTLQELLDEIIRLTEE